MNPGLRTAALFLLLTAIFVVFGWAIGSVFFANWIGGVATFLVLAAAMNAIAYFLSDRIVLWSYQARIVSESEAPDLYRVVRRVAALHNMPMPKVALIPSATPNAMATGRNPHRAVVAATEGLLRIVDERELTGVIAHEMAHVRDRDILVMSVAATLAGALSFLSRIFWYNIWFGGVRSRDSPVWVYVIALAGLIVAPIAALLVQLAISRSREYKADYVGARTIGAPDALADALQKLEYANRQRPMTLGSPAASGLWITNPYPRGTFVRMFSTHPPIGERIEKLRLLARGQDTY